MLFPVNPTWYYPGIFHLAMVVVQQVQALETSVTANVSTEEAISINISRLANQHQVIWRDSPTTKTTSSLTFFSDIRSIERELCHWVWLPCALHGDQLLGRLRHLPPLDPHGGRLPSVSSRFGALLSYRAAGRLSLFRCLSLSCHKSLVLTFSYFAGLHCKGYRINPRTDCIWVLPWQDMCSVGSRLW